MSDRSLDTLNCESPQAMSIHTRKITDSCRDKDCIEDLRVYLTACSQNLLNNASGAKVRSAELLFANIEVEPIAFDRNHYCIEVTFYYQILADANVGTCRPAVLTGVAVFSKRAVLCGEDSRAHIFRSGIHADQCDAQTLRYTNRPTAVVEVTDTNSIGQISMEDNVNNSLTLSLLTTLCAPCMIVLDRKISFHRRILLCDLENGLPFAWLCCWQFLWPDVLITASPFMSSP